MASYSAGRHLSLIAAPVHFEAGWQLSNAAAGFVISSDGKPRWRHPIRIPAPPLLPRSPVPVCSSCLAACRLSNESMSWRTWPPRFRRRVCSWPPRTRRSPSPIPSSESSTFRPTGPSWTLTASDFLNAYQLAGKNEAHGILMLGAGCGLAEPICPARPCQRCPHHFHRSCSSALRSAAQCWPGELGHSLSADPRALRLPRPVSPRHRSRPFASHGGAALCRGPEADRGEPLRYAPLAGQRGLGERFRDR